MSQYVDTANEPSFNEAADIEQRYTLARYADDQYACSWLQETADLPTDSQDNLIAAAYVSILYQKGCRYISIDLDKAAKYARKAMPWVLSEAARGNPFAQFNLAYCAEDGRGAVKNEEQAIIYYKLAADQAHAYAQINLGEKSHCNNELYLLVQVHIIHVFHRILL